MIQGSLQTMPLTDLVSWIGRADKTGTLTIEGTDYTTRLIFRDGLLISSSSNDPSSYFGQYLLAHTALTEEDLRRAFELQERTKVRLRRNIFIKTLLGKILNDEGMLPASEIERVLRLKTEETVYNAFLWVDGFFRFQPNELPPEELLPIALDVERVVDAGHERLQLARRIRQQIPSLRSSFRVDPERVPPGLEMSGLESRILLLLGQRKMLAEIMLELHLSRFATENVIYGFIKQGFVSCQPPPAPSREEPPPDEEGSVQDLIERSQESYQKGEYEDTIIAARRALQEDPGALEARRLLERGERELADSYYAKHFDRDDIPYLVGEPPPQTEYSAVEKFLLGRINGAWDVATIVKISPLKEVETLACLRDLIDRGLVAVRSA